jgi:hypothetical protein
LYPEQAIQLAGMFPGQRWPDHLSRDGWPDDGPADEATLGGRPGRHGQRPGAGIHQRHPRRIFQAGRTVPVGLDAQFDIDGNLILDFDKDGHDK